MNGAPVLMAQGLLSQICLRMQRVAKVLCFHSFALSLLPVIIMIIIGGFVCWLLYVVGWHMPCMGYHLQGVNTL